MNGTWLAARPVSEAQPGDYEALHPQPAPVVTLGNVPSAQSLQQQPRQQHRIHGPERHGCMGISRPLHLRCQCFPQAIQRLKQHCPLRHGAGGQQVILVALG